MKWQLIDISNESSHTASNEGILDQIIQLYRAQNWWKEPEDNRESLIRLIANSHVFAVALSENQQVLGMGRAISDHTSDAYIQDVAVDAAYRKCGIGKHIVSFLIDTLRQSGISWIGLISQNHTYSFYRKLGFNPMKAVAMILP
jgi:ribosomal protein S18 acetylase RimI-like enzyme